jgi:hypothetical protein
MARIARSLIQSMQGRIREKAIQKKERFPNEAWRASQNFRIFRPVRVLRHVEWRVARRD